MRIRRALGEQGRNRALLRPPPNAQQSLDASREQGDIGDISFAAKWPNRVPAKGRLGEVRPAEPCPALRNRADDRYPMRRGGALRRALEA